MSQALATDGGSSAAAESTAASTAASAASVSAFNASLQGLIDRLTIAIGSLGTVSSAIREIKYEKVEKTGDWKGRVEKVYLDQANAGKKDVASLIKGISGVQEAYQKKISDLKAEMKS